MIIEILNDEMKKENELKVDDDVLDDFEATASLIKMYLSMNKKVLIG